MSKQMMIEFKLQFSGNKYVFDFTFEASKIMSKYNLA